MNSFLLVTNNLKDKDWGVTKQIIDFLEKKGKSYFHCHTDANSRIADCVVAGNYDCAIIIGGDGTFMEAAREFYDLDIPLLGINMGSLGFLTEVEVGDIDSKLEKLLAGDYVVDQRMMLEAVSSKQTRNIALNDVAISRSRPLAIRFSIYVDDILLNRYDADGMIVSSPTGSTAYNLSAGGPIVEPTASLVLLTPICAHTLGSASIVLSGDKEIKVVIERAKNGSNEKVDIAFDGRDMITLESTDYITIKKASCQCKIIRFSNRSFVEIVREKMKGN